MKRDQATEMEKDKPAYLKHRVAYGWAFFNAVGISMTICSVSAGASSFEALLVIEAVLVAVCGVIPWLFLREQVSQSWRWALAGLGGWMLSFIIILGMLNISSNFLSQASQLPTGFMAGGVFVLVAMTVGPLVMIALLALAKTFLVCSIDSCAFILSTARQNR